MNTAILESQIPSWPERAPTAFLNSAQRTQGNGTVVPCGLAPDPVQPMPSDSVDFLEISDFSHWLSKLVFAVTDTSEMLDASWAPFHAASSTFCAPSASGSFAPSVVVIPRIKSNLGGYNAFQRRGRPLSLQQLMEGLGIANSSILSKKSRAWLEIANSVNDELSLSEVSTIIASISEQLRENQSSEVDRALEVSRPDKMCRDAIVAISRITFPARHDLRHWEKFVERANNSLSIRGKKPQKFSHLRT